MKLHRPRLSSGDGSSLAPTQQIATGRAPRARRRPDPLAGVWIADVLPMLEANPWIRPVAIFEKIRQDHPEFRQGVRRTLERRIRDWQATSGPDRELMLRRDPRQPSNDILAAFWNSLVEPILKILPANRANAVFDEICRRHPVSAEMCLSLHQRNRGPRQEVLRRQHHALAIGLSFDLIRAAHQETLRLDDLPRSAQQHESICHILKFCKSGTLVQRSKALLALGVICGVPLSHLATYPISTEASLYRWKGVFLRLGFETLIQATLRTKLRSKDSDVSAAIFKTLHEPPTLHGFSRTNWRQVDLKRALDAKGVRVSAWTIRRAIRAAKYQWRKAKVVLTSNDPNYRSKVDHIKKILGSLREDECFFSIDEYGPFAIRLVPGRKLCAPGEVPSVPQWQRGRGTLIITGALELRSNQITHFYSDHKNTSEMIRMVDILRRQYRSMKKLYISWDAAGWHISKALGKHVEFLNGWADYDCAPQLELAPLPSRAQFLNVIESVFSGMSRAGCDSGERGHRRIFREQERILQASPKARWT